MWWGFPCSSLWPQRTKWFVLFLKKLTLLQKRCNTLKRVLVLHMSSVCFIISEKKPVLPSHHFKLTTWKIPTNWILSCHKNIHQESVSLCWKFDFGKSSQNELQWTGYTTYEKQEMCHNFGGEPSWKVGMGKLELWLVEDTKMDLSKTGTWLRRGSSGALCGVHVLE
jgi:hypothetical protein